MSRRRRRGSDRYQEAKARLRLILLALAPRLGLTEREVDLLVGLAQIMFFEEHDTIFAKHQTHDFSYVLIDGLVRLECAGHRGEQLTMQLVAPGRLFGVSWLPHRRPREVTAVAHTECSAALITQADIAAVFGRMSTARRATLMSYQWRVLSRLVVQLASRRPLDVKDRIVEALWDLARDFAVLQFDRVRLGIPVTSSLLASMIAAGDATVRTGVAELLDAGVLARDPDGFFLLRPSPPAPAAPPGGPYRGRPAPYARESLRNLLGRCSHLGLNAAAAEVVYRHADLFEVPKGESLLPSRSAELVAFVVEGSAWLDGVRHTGEPVAIKLVPPGWFVRLPTGSSIRGMRVQARAHQDSIVALLSVDHLQEAIAAMAVVGALQLLDGTCRVFSRHLCDMTSAPGRARTCRLLSTFTHLAHDFGKRVEPGIRVDAPLIQEDLGRLIDTDHAGVCKTLPTLSPWVETVAPQRYLLRELPPPPTADGHCQVCLL